MPNFSNGRDHAIKLSVNQNGLALITNIYITRGRKTDKNTIKKTFFFIISVKKILQIWNVKNCKNWFDPKCIYKNNKYTKISLIPGHCSILTS